VISQIAKVDTIRRFKKYTLTKISTMSTDFLSFIKRNGFIWGPEPEIYGGVAGFYTYGPTGKLLKNNVENKIREVFVSNGFWEIEAPIIMPEIVWKASGHLEKFVDPIVSCKKCDSSFRADKLIEEKFSIVADSMTPKQLLAFIKKKGMKCPTCGGEFENKIREFNLMMKTQIGKNEVAYNRPETATTTYLPFKNYYDFFRSKMPIKVFQIGKVFRNEVSPRQNVLRGREFTQAESQLFIFKEDKNKFEPYKALKNEKLPLWSATNQNAHKGVEDVTLAQAIKKGWVKTQAYACCLFLAYKFMRTLGISKNRIRYRQHKSEEMAHYAAEAWDLEVKTNVFGWIEVVGVHDRQDYDLKQHAKHSKKDLSVEGKYPHILEIAFGSDRPTFVLLDNHLKVERVKDQDRAVLKLPVDIAPLQAAVFPLVSKDKVPELAEKVFWLLQEHFPGFTFFHDEKGSIGRRYRRQDQIGTPFCITIDYQTKEDDTVTVRYRDSMLQERVKINNLIDFFRSYFK